MVTVTSNRSNPIQSVGSNVTLTCIVKLTPVVDVSLTVNTVWTGPAGFMANNTMEPGNENIMDISVVQSDTFTYKSRALVTSFTRENSGFYNCTASATAQHPYLTNFHIEASNATRFTTG